MTDRARTLRLLLDAARLPERWWWLSFADARRPEGSQFLGVVIIRGRGIGWASRRAHELGINPGGEVQGQEFPESAKVPMEFTDRLLTKAECSAADAEIARLNP